MAPLKVLCLHGYRQNAQSFRVKTGSFRKLLKNKCEFEFISAPNLVDTDESNGNAWWFSNPSGFTAQEKSDCDKGFQESVQYVQKYLEVGHFDGILGFSQGAAFAFILQIMMEHQLLEFSDWNNPLPKFTILVAPFLSQSTIHSEFYQYKSHIPTLIVSGNTDVVIPRVMTEEVFNSFESKPVIYYHEEGHYIPTNSSAKQMYDTFISQFS